MTSPTVLISCGEASGERYAVDVARALRATGRQPRLVGVGGPALAAAGVELWADRTELAVMGFAEVVRHLPRLWRLRGALERRARREGVDLFLPVDYPGFHMSLASRLRRQGVGVLSLIPPKTWSWAAWRNRGLRRAVDQCAVIFPFEETYYRERDIPATFVGHPLAGRARALPPQDRSGLLVVPGSRRQELAQIGGVLGQAAAALRAQGLVQNVRVSRAPGVEASWLGPLLAAIPEAQVVEGELLVELGRAEAALVTSGTASFEAALTSTPHLIAYRTSPLTYAVARRLATVTSIGMANIVLGRRAFPELVQDELTVDRVVELAAPLLRADSSGRREQAAAFQELRDLLPSKDWAEAVADMAWRLLEARRGAF